MMRMILVVAACCVAFVSCAPPAPDMGKIRSEVQALLDKAEKDMMAGTIDTTLSHYTDDAISLPNNSPMLKGKAAIKAYSDQMMGMGMTFTDVDFSTVELMAAGQYVYEVGTYTMTVRIPGMPDMQDKGKYITVYQRMEDGSLKIKAEAWNTDTMPPMPGSAG